jgi:hypothetical protein
MSSTQQRPLLRPSRAPRRSRVRYVVPPLLAVPFAALVVFAVFLTTSKATISASDTALATIKLPLGGAKIVTLGAVGGREQKALPVRLLGDTVWPAQSVPAGEKVTILATVKRPGWNSWLTGGTRQLKLTVTTPKAALETSYVTVHHGSPVVLHFSRPVVQIAYGDVGAPLTHRTLATPTSSFAIPEAASAGTLEVKADARPWETAAAQAVSWFPAGASATAIASPVPGTRVAPTTPITLTFSKTVHQVLGSALPDVTPGGSGSWQTLSSHAIRFVPSGYGYGLGATVRIALPAGVHLVGGASPAGGWSVPAGSTLRLQQLLAELDYLPVKFDGPSAGASASDQVAAAIHPPAGSFSWLYPHTPSALTALWKAGTYGELTKGAIMSFEDDQGMTPDGIAGPQVWKALIAAALKGQKNASGYTFVSVHEGSSGESETTWHNGSTVVSGAVNTGVAAAGGTAPGVFAVFEHLRSTTMSGKNPDGSTYHDPNIPDVSYFNGGDALHGFVRASYGFPQSDGCVEMPYSEAASVFPYTPVGTIVDVS